jgi:hypothetical protein
VASSCEGKETLLNSYLTVTITLRAPLFAATRCRTTSGTGLTCCSATDGNFLLTTEGRFFEGNLHIIPKIVSCPTLTSSPSSASSAAKKGAKHITENVLKAGEICLESATTALFECGVTVLVVFGAGVGVTEHRVGVSGLLEFIFGFFIAWVLIGVELNSLFSIGFFYLVGGSCARDTQHFIVIAF